MIDVHRQTSIVMAHESGPSRWNGIAIKQMGSLLRNEIVSPGWPAVAGHDSMGRGEREQSAMQKYYWTYILASARNGTLYVGVTNDIFRRMWEHREGLVSGFTKKYGVKMLVHFAVFQDVNAAIHQEKLWKKWKRRWKIEPIEKHNPEWRDLTETLNA